MTEAIDWGSDSVIIRSGMEPVYPGSHELQPIALVQVEHDLVPEGIVVVSRLRRSEKPQDQEELKILEQNAGLLDAVASAISDQAISTRLALTRIYRSIR